MTTTSDVITEQKVPEANEKKQDTQTKIESTNATPAETQETSEQINWKKFREAREVDRKKREEAERNASQKAAEAAALKEAMEAILNKPSNHSQRSESTSRDVTSYSDEETEEQRINRQVEAAIKKNDEARENERRKREAAELPSRLKNTYGDFERVCTSENLDYLEYHHPLIAKGIKNQADGFDKWADAYQAIKKYVPNTDSKKEQAKIEKNLAKPQSMSQPGMANTGDHAPTDLTEQRRKDNWLRMQRTLKGIK